MEELFEGIFQPEQLVALKVAFDEITSQAWFDQSATSKAEFAKYLIATFPGDNFSPRKHRLVIETSARMFYSSEDQLDQVRPSEGRQMRIPTSVR